MKNFTFHEALLALHSIVAWADSKNDDAESDLRIRLKEFEGITKEEYAIFLEKWEWLDTKNEIFNLAIEQLNECSYKAKARACAWMWKTAIISSESAAESKYYSDDKEYYWKTDKNNVSKKEDEWIDKAMEKLSVSAEDLNNECGKLPRIKRI